MTKRHINSISSPLRVASTSGIMDPFVALSLLRSTIPKKSRVSCDPRVVENGDRQDRLCGYLSDVPVSG